MLIAADDALDTVVDSILRSNNRSLTKERIERSLAEDQSEVDNKFRKALDLLSDFVKEFPLKDSTSDDLDPNISGTVTGEVKTGNNSKSATIILQALKTDLHSNVKFPIYICIYIFQH